MTWLEVESEEGIDLCTGDGRLNLLNIQLEIAMIHQRQWKSARNRDFIDL